MSVKAFMKKVEFGNGQEECWHWLGAIGSDGYGRLKHHGKSYQAHRFSYESFKGPIPRDLCVLHQCDNPRCVNPTHLIVGTILDNHRDKVSKGRQGLPLPKLTIEDVQEIRALIDSGEKRAVIARRFGVCRSTVQDIDKGRSWQLDSNSCAQLSLDFPEL